MQERTRWIPTLYVGHRMMRWLVIAVAYLALVAGIATVWKIPAWAEGDEATAFFSFALGILLVFRTQAADQRWWEARKLWGQLVNETRNLILKAQAHANATDADLQRLGSLLSRFAHALRLHLRSPTPPSELPGLEHAPPLPDHIPGAIAGQVHQLLNQWNRAGQLRESLWILDPHARSLMDICGACERIRNTPLPSSYRAIVRWGIVLYIAITPWTLEADIGWRGLPFLLLAFVFLLGIELTAQVVEEPFGTEGDDLPLEHICLTIDDFIKQVVGSDDAS